MFPGSKIVLNIGHLEPRKNQRYLVQVAAELRHHDPSFVLVLVGKGEDEAILKQMIAEAKLEQNVVLLGYHRNVVALLHAADLYVHAATRENCPLVLIESMAAGCPAVALAVGGIPELLAATPDALVPVTTEPAVMAKHLGTLLASPDALSRMQQQQHKFGKIQFDASTMVVRTVAFFEQARQHQQPVPDSTIGQTINAAQPSYLEALPSAKEVG